MTTEDIHGSGEPERRAHNLEAVLRYSRRLSSSLDLDSTLSSTCRAVVELFNVSHSSFILPTPDYNTGRVRAEFPEIGVRDLTIRLGEKEEAKRLGTIKAPLFIENAQTAPQLSAVRDIVLALNIQSILIVPITSNQETLAYFTLDTIDYTRSYTREEIELCEVFAAQAAVAIRNARHYEEMSLRAEQLEALRQTTLSITSKLDRNALLDEIVEQAVGLLKAKNGGVFEFDPSTKGMTVIIDSSQGGRKRGVTLFPGQGMAGRLVLSDEWYMIVNHYDEWPGRAPVIVGRRPSGAVLEVKIVWQGQLTGTLFVEDDVPREFTRDDAQLLKWFADHAAIAMNNAKLVRELEERQEGLTNLSLAAQSLLPGNIDPMHVLQKIAMLAMKSLDGNSATIWPYDKSQDKFLVSDVVMIGITGEEQQEFKNQTPPPGGISRRVMSEGWLGVENVEADYEFMKATPRRELLLRMGIKSFQGIVLKADEEPVGVMYVNYNEARSFSGADKRRMESLGSNAALALVIVRNARLSMEPELVTLSEYLLAPLDRQDILDRSVKAARRLLNTDRSSIVLLDNKDRLFIVAEDGEPGLLTGKAEVAGGRHSQTGYTIEMAKSLRIYDYEVEKEVFTQSEPVIDKGLKSGMSIPMLSGPNIIGAMLVHSLNRRNFTPAEEETLNVIANLAAGAIVRWDAVERNSIYLSALYKASKAILEESGKAIREKRFEHKGILHEIVKQAVTCLVDSHGPKASIGTLRYYDDKSKELSLDSVYSLDEHSEMRGQIGKRRRIVGVPDNEVGYAGLAALTGEAQLIHDVKRDERSQYYYEFIESTRSELVVPMIYQGKVIGVLNVESDRPAAFDEMDKRELQLLADFAVIAISNAEQINELREIDKRVLASTAVAFMGMASSIWGHSIRGYTINIRELVRAVQTELKRTFIMPRKRNSFDDKLKRIEKLATQILERPIIEPLGSDRGVEVIPVRDLIEERVRQLRQIDPFGLPLIKFNFSPDDRAFVHGHRQWLRRAFDILLDNALEAMKNVEPGSRTLTISTSVTGSRVEVAIGDTGPGIKPELLDKILREPLKRNRGEGGSGIGLLMAQTIINAYGGEIQVGSSSKEGTTMVVWLPVARGE